MVLNLLLSFCRHSKWSFQWTTVAIVTSLLHWQNAARHTHTHTNTEYNHILVPFTMPDGPFKTFDFHFAHALCNCVAICDSNPGDTPSLGLGIRMYSNVCYGISRYNDTLSPHQLPKHSIYSTQHIHGSVHPSRRSMPLKRHCNENKSSVKSFPLTNAGLPSTIHLYVGMFCFFFLFCCLTYS